jgi:predicted amidohydrolase YtcJ
MPLDTLVTGRIATFAGPSGFGFVEAVGIRNGKVAFAGTAIELETRADPLTYRIELEPGEIALPGLTDAHLHLVGASIAADEIDLVAAPTLDAALDLVREAARRHPAPAWILGSGWDSRRWGAWPTAAALETAAPGRLVSLQSADHHAEWASMAALALAGVDASTPDPAGGVIRRTADGGPEGVLMENARNLITAMDLFPEPEPEIVRRAVREYGRELLGVGIVGVHDPGSLALDPSNRHHALYAEMAEAGDLPIRVHACVRADGLDHAIQRGVPSGGALAPESKGRLEMGWLKLFADGTLGSQTAALLDPVEGTSNRGIFTTPPDEMRELATRARAAGISTMIHAIGDHAVREALDILGPLSGRAAFMPRIEHVQLCHPADRSRFALLGVAASVQPIHLRSDAAKARTDWGDRAETSGYTFRSLLDAGAIVAFGTDAPVEPADPWPGIALAVLRRDPTWGAYVEPYGPHEALTLEEALRAATVAPAATRRDRLGGRLIPGSPADLIVLPAAPRESPDAGERAAAYATVRPRLVMLEGEVVLER